MVSFSKYCFVILLLFSFAGCDTSGRFPLAGKVQYAEQPIDYGYIQFSPLPGTVGPTSGADIKEGAYRIPAEQGLMRGSYRVSIQAWKRAKSWSIDPVTGERTEGGDMKQFLPVKYNDDSELTIEIGTGTDTFDFDLDQ